MLFLAICLINKDAYEPTANRIDDDTGCYILGGVERFDLPFNKDMASLTARIDCAW